MTDIRCPMCGKPNPEDREACLHCGARLKPLSVDPGENRTPPEGEQDEDRAQSPSEPAWEPDASEELPDWLQSLRPESEEAGLFDEQGEVELSDADLPDWLKGSSGDEPEPRSETTDRAWEWPESSGDFKPDTGRAEDEPVSEAELPGWLSALDASPGLSEPETGQESGSPIDEGELPEWLQKPSPAVEETGEQSPSGEQRLDWLDETEPEIEPGEAVFESPAQTDLGEEALTPSAESAPAEPEDEPEWLSRISDLQAAKHEGAIEEAQAFGDEEQIKPGIAGSEAGIPPEPEPSPGEMDMPTSKDEEAVLQPGGAAVFSIPEVPVESAGQGDTDLDWLEAAPLKEQAEEPGTTEEVASGVPEVVGAALLFESASEDLDSETLFAEPGEEEPILEEAELPEWLSGAADQQAQDVAPSGEQELAGEEEGLAAANLPSWLNAMQPVETAAPPLPPIEEGEGQVTSGPLSGLKGLLPAEPEVARTKRTSAYTVKLQVAESQRAHADMFTALIASEGAVQRKTSRTAVSSSQVLRLVIFVILLAAVLWPILIRSQTTSLPVVPVEVAEANQAIEALPSGAPVLLAVDFEPGFLGELEASAGAVIDHLMNKGVYLALVSTTPTGPLQGERLLSGVNFGYGQAYSGMSQYANLGFIPGGAAGLRSFAEDPRATIPFAMAQEGQELAGDRVWADTPLRGVRQASDFAMVVLLTENPDTARAWIEQVQPMLGSAPLILVSSAQADPLIRPYYEGNPQQVQGMISGLAGGSAYENATGRYGFARQAWDAYAFSLPIAAVLILLGVALSAMSYLTASRRRSRRSTGSAKP